jgi:hypothetical protein
MKPACLAVSAAIAAAWLTACAGSEERSRKRWEALYTPVDLRKWQHCIEVDSGRWWRRHYVGDPSDPGDVARPNETRDQGFAAILAGCRIHAETPWWTSLPARQRRRLVQDARVRFDTIGVQIWAEMFESVI